MFHPIRWILCCGQREFRISGVPAAASAPFSAPCSPRLRIPVGIPIPLRWYPASAAPDAWPVTFELDSFHTTHGRALPFATGLKLARPQTKVIVVSGDGDLFAIGGNHFIHAARRNMDMTVICVNNLNYGMTGGQQAPSTPLGAKTTTSVNGSPEEPFNFCYLASACGATYVARWTAMQVRSLRSSISEALEKRGFSFVEVITPCPSSFGRRNRMGSALEMLKFYQGRSVIRGDIDPKDASMDIDKEIVVGKFVDIERPTFMDHYEKFNRPQMPQWRSMHPDTQKGR